MPTPVPSESPASSALAWTPGVVGGTHTNIPNSKERAVPQFLLRGTTDTVIQNAEVQNYTDALKAAGQRAEYVQVPGAAHAFLDWKPDTRTKDTFRQFGVPYAAKMKDFFDSIFYPKSTQP